MFLNYGCWHIYLELLSSNIHPTRYDPTYNVPCGDKCPHCRNEIINFVKVINHQNLCCFLVQTMTNTTKTFDPIQLGDELYNYPNCGRLIFNRKFALKAERKSDCYMAILQLILANILEVKVVPSDHPTMYCFLPHDTNCVPHYLSSYYWTYIRHI